MQNLTGYIKVVDLCDISINATDNLTGRLKNVSKTKVKKRLMMCFIDLPDR